MVKFVTASGLITTLNLTATGTITLPSSGISDSALSSNIPKKDQFNVWTNYNDYYNPITMYNGWLYMKN